MRASPARAALCVTRPTSPGALSRATLSPRKRAERGLIYMSRNLSNVATMSAAATSAKTKPLAWTSGSSGVLVSGTT